MNTKKYTGIILAGIMVCAVFAAAMPAMVSAAVTGGETDVSTTNETYAGTTAGDVAATGGNITQVNLSSKTQTSKWQGYYGNLSGDIALRGTGGTHAMYTWATWSNESDTGYVYATPNETTPTWSTLDNVTTTAIDFAWSFGTSDKDCANSTYTNESNTEITVDSKTHGADWTASVKTYNHDAGANTWETVALKDGTNTDSFVFVGINNATASASAFNDKSCDYQMMVPVKATVGDTYYFYAELL